MTKQNNISFQNTKAANAPFIDIEFEVVRPGPEFEHLQVQFAYDIFLVNRGNGPAFKIVVRRLIDCNQNLQKIAEHPVQNRLGQFTKNIKVLGKGERFKLRREQSASYEWQKYDLMYWDIFKDQHTCEYEGDRDQLKLISYSGINRVD